VDSSYGDGVPEVGRAALLTGAAAGVAGDELLVVGLAWSVLAVTGSPAQLSLVLGTLAAVPLVAAPLAGALIDRPRGPDWLVGSETTAAAALVAAAGWLTVRPADLPFFLALAVAVPLFSSLSRPALPVLLTRLGPAGTAARSLARAQVAVRLGRVAGPLLGGALVGTGDLRWCCLADALSYLVSAAGWAAARRALPAAAGPTRERGVRGGLRYAVADRPLRALLAVALAANASIAAVTVLLPLLARGPLGAGAGTYGLLQAAFQVGVLATAVGLSVRALPDRLVGDRRALGTALVALGLCYAGLAASRAVPVAVVAAAAAGAALGVTSLISDTRLVVQVPVGLRGRVMGLATGLAGALRPAGALAGGLLAGLVGAPAAAGAAGLALVLLGVRVARRGPGP
jgi:hypothetical protein